VDWIFVSMSAWFVPLGALIVERKACHCWGISSKPLREGCTMSGGRMETLGRERG